jgi:hypothetical protein
MTTKGSDMTTNAKGDCGSAKTDCGNSGLCQYDGLSRPKFFHGMLLTDDHLRDEQAYHRESLKRLNRYLWGSGIVCGLDVTPIGGLCIKVNAGFALDCGGNAIEVCKPITIDLAAECKKVYPGSCMPQNADPITRHLVIRYAEVAADPQPVLTDDEDCAGQSQKCQPSRTREGFCLELQETCPNEKVCPDTKAGVVSSLLNVRGTAGARKQLEDQQPRCMELTPPCPACGCTDCAVGLATLVIDCAGGKVDVTCECRSYVWSPRLLRWLVCGLFNGLDAVPNTKAGLDPKAAGHLPPAALIANRPLESAWRAAVELSAAQDRTDRLEARMQALHDRVEDVAKRVGRPGGKGGTSPNP